MWYLPHNSHVGNELRYFSLHQQETFSASAHPTFREMELESEIFGKIYQALDSIEDCICAKCMQIPNRDKNRAFRCKEVCR
jgi:hypothetical protein